MSDSRPLNVDLDPKDKEYLDHNIAVLLTVQEIQNNLAIKSGNVKRNIEDIIKKYPDAKVNPWVKLMLER